MLLLQNDLFSSLKDFWYHQMEDINAPNDWDPLIINDQIIVSFDDGSSLKIETQKDLDCFKKDQISKWNPNKHYV